MPYRIKSIFICVVIVVVGGLIQGCSATPSRAISLEEAVNGASQDEVTEHLGPPNQTRKLENGDTRWQYQYQSSRGGNTHCREYLLTFDGHGILRYWERLKCSS